MYSHDFSLGHPAYFDLSVRCTTQSYFISSAVSQAGTAGEEAKDNHYLETFNNYGVDFIPLICELVGVWSPYALSTLFTIVDCPAVKNGLSQR